MTSLLSRMFAVALLCCVLAAPAFAGYERINAPNPDDAMDVHIYRLDNGLTVYLTRNTETPRFYSEISVRAGSKHDPANATGLAHYLEHLLFKGTEQLGTIDYEKEKPYLDKIVALYEEHFVETDPQRREELYAEINRTVIEGAQYAVPNEFDRLYSVMGSSNMNAHTSFEETVYKVGLPMNRLEQWARVEAQRFEQPVFRLFHTELEIVYEEQNRARDNKQRAIFDAMFDQMFKEHPYGQQPTIGTVEHLKNPSLVLIQEYFDTYYVPNNMAITISGNIDIEETIEIIDRNFGGWEPGEIPEYVAVEEAPIDGVERVEVSFPAEDTLSMTYRTVPLHHPDVEALMIFDSVLTNATAGLIDLNLNQKQLVRSVSSWPMMLNDYGLQSFSGVPKEGQTLEEVEQLILEQIELVKAGEFDDDLIPAIINEFKKREKASLESDVNRVSAMRDAFITFTDWDNAVGALARLEAVTREDVIRVANTYFDNNYVAVYRREGEQELPNIKKPQIDPVPIDPSKQSEFFREILAMPAEPIEPEFITSDDYAHVVMDNGNEIYYVKNPLNDLFALGITVEKGTFEDDRIGMATALIDKSGTAELSPGELKKEWYKLGTGFGVGAGRNESSISITGLDENFEASLKLMFDVVQNAQSDEQTLQTLKAIALKSREDAKKDPRSLLRALSQFQLYGEDSSYLRQIPAEELQALTTDELYALVRELLDYKQIVTYVGSLSLEEVKAALERTHPTFASDDLKDPPAYTPTHVRSVDENQIYFLNRPGAQAQVQIQFADGEYDPAATMDAVLFNNYFGGGMSSIVFQRLREARGLAYTAYAAYRQGSRVEDENIMLGYIGCQTDKTPDATEAFVELLDNLPAEPSRFAGVVDSLISAYRTGHTGFRGVIGAVRAWEQLGLDSDPRAERYELIFDVELEDVLAFHEERLAEQPKMISIVGDSEKAGLDALANVGTIREVAVDQIFVD